MVSSYTHGDMILQKHVSSAEIDCIETARSREERQYLCFDYIAMQFVFLLLVEQTELQHAQSGWKVDNIVSEKTKKKADTKELQSYINGFLKYTSADFMQSVMQDFHGKSFCSVWFPWGTNMSICQCKLASYWHRQSRSCWHPLHPLRWGVVAGVKQERCWQLANVRRSARQVVPWPPVDSRDLQFITRDMHFLCRFC